VKARLIAFLAVLALAPLQARAQTVPLSGIDLSQYYDVAMAAARNNTDDVRALLLAGKTPDVTDGKGQTPLDYAANFGNVEMTRLLLRYKAPVDSTDQFGNTALHWAAQRGSVEIIKLLLDAKAAVDAQNKQGVTPLMMAAKNGQVMAVRVLLAHGADPHRQDYTGRDAIGWAAGKPGVIEALRAAKLG
jgi:uncharacterized protein